MLCKHLEPPLISLYLTFKEQEPDKWSDRWIILQLIQLLHSRFSALLLMKLKKWEQTVSLMGCNKSVSFRDKSKARKKNTQFNMDKDWKVNIQRKTMKALQRTLRPVTQDHFKDYKKVLFYVTWIYRNKRCLTLAQSTVLAVAQSLIIYWL